MELSPPRSESLSALLDRLTAEPALELEWVDLLSQLEYIGCRKIVKAIPYDEMTLERLRHLSEEASHAFLLRAAAEECGLPGRSWREGILSEAGWRYFRELDRGVEAGVTDRSLCYPLVSAAVERRVLALYPAYLKRTRLKAVRRALAVILAQEKRHARQFDGLGLPEAEVRSALRLEERLWSEFEAAVGRVLHARAVP